MPPLKAERIPRFAIINFSCLWFIEPDSEFSAADTLLKSRVSCLSAHPVHSANCFVIVLSCRIKHLCLPTASRGPIGSEILLAQTDRFTGAPQPTDRVCMPEELAAFRHFALLLEISVFGRVLKGGKALWRVGRCKQKAQWRSRSAYVILRRHPSVVHLRGPIVPSPESRLYG